jgi:peptide/nickel transport system substrate-binding protein
MSITYKLLPGVSGPMVRRLTADDVVFTWQYCTDPETGCTYSQQFAAVSETVEAVDAVDGQDYLCPAQPLPVCTLMLAICR